MNQHLNNHVNSENEKIQQNFKTCEIKQTAN